MSEEYSRSEDIPPVIACATCGRGDCEGCSQILVQPPSPGASTLPWETGEGTALERLLITAKLTAARPDDVFGQLAGSGAVAPGPSSSRSWQSELSFAFWAEFLAVGSFCVLWGAGFFALFPGVAWQMLHSPLALGLGASIFFSMVFGVVLIHALWGLGLEWGAGRAGATRRYGMGMRFGMYACGWDLLTSPAGVVLHLLPPGAFGLRAGLYAISEGARAPRRAVKSYLSNCRGLTDAQRRSAIRASILVVGLGLLSGCALGLVALVLLFFPWLLA